MDGHPSDSSFRGTKYVPLDWPKKYRPIGFWEIYDTPNQPYRELEIHTSWETNTYKRRNFEKDPQ